MFARKSRAARTARIAMIAEALDPRLILDAPLTLASDGLLLAGPTADELIEPALFAEASAPAVQARVDIPPAPAPVDPLPVLPPEDDPLSPIGDPQSPSDAGTAAAASCCGACITYAVSVVNISSVEEAAPTVPGWFRFTAIASCSAGAPPSITVSYSLTGSTAAKDVDYNGAIGLGTVTIPLTAGQGSKDVDYYAIDDSVDEPDEYVKVTIPATPIIIPDPTYGVAYGHIADNDVEWAAGDPIQGTITTTAGDNPAIPINHTLGLTLTASDRDQMKDNGVWTDYWDDVTSGETAADYHVKWTASEGSFVVAGTSSDVAYGTTVTYLAPDYMQGMNERNVTITASVDDVNRGNDTLGFNDQAIQVGKGVKVWQIQLTVSQNGNLSPNYDGEAVRPSAGGGRLGWLVPNNPPQTAGYLAGTEIKATVPIPGRPTGWQFYQQKKGTKNLAVNGVWNNPPSYSSADWQRDIYPDDPAYRDEDTRHPDGPGGADVGEGFLFDAPGWEGAGVNNNGGIVADGLTAVSFDMHYRTWVQLGGVRISNRATWDVAFDLQAQNGVWVPTRHAP